MTEYQNYNKERLKMSIPIYGLREVFLNAAERHGSEEELILWGIYQVFASSPAVYGIAYGLVNGLELLVSK